MCAIPQLVSAPLNPIPTAEHFRRSHHSVSTVTDKTFKGDRLQINVASEHILILYLFISRMPKMCAIPQLVSAPLNPIPTAEHFRRSHHSVSTVTDKTC